MIKIVEVGPRDGLQNERGFVLTDVKVDFVNALAESGVTEIEASAFVSPKKIPQLSDAADVFQNIKRKNGVVYSALVPNMKGLEAAVSNGVDKVTVFTAASETFNQNNINTDIAGSLKRFKPVVREAKSLNLPVRGYISTAFWCGYEGRIAPGFVVELAGQMMDMGMDELSISDTIGKATPDEVALFMDLLLPHVPADRIAVHFHDTYCRGVANSLKSAEFGIKVFDASVGGLGGCPYAPGATGNVATEAVVKALSKAGHKVSVDTEKLAQAYQVLKPHLKRTAKDASGNDTRTCIETDSD